MLTPALGGAEGSCGDRVVPIGGDPINRGGDSGPTGGAGGPAGSGGSGGSTSDAGTAESSKPDACTQTPTQIRNLIAAHQNCASHGDCTTVVVTCLSNSRCSGVHYVNVSLDLAELERLDRELNACVNGDPQQSCPVCDILDAPPACVDGACRAKGATGMPVDPCAGKKCHEECITCVPVPDQPCDTILGLCDANGVCGGPATCP
jgi:hypothetical protein